MKRERDIYEKTLLDDQGVSENEIEADSSVEDEDDITFF